ncbi:fibroblast growth factor-binding protein 1 [Cynoglossus semilaevis]|uniref:Fibroblast growth factor binding protein 1a n=1 Tax=Cynoglossus semilaevis TaxID=244447 RepID=A0A3P8UUU7_CYNSE|nr:fibroblast growth factor-binding protein 1-like [Cynoglossus semilaevis]
MASSTNTTTIVLLLACVSYELMLGCSHKADGQNGRGVDRGEKLSRQPKSTSAQQVKGKVVTRDRSECTWAAAGQDLLVLSVTCKKGRSRSVSCEYVGKPFLCTEYAANVGLYWKQISRALKKQRSLCENHRALVKAGMCRGAEKEAHFRLYDPQTTTSAPPAATTVRSCQPVNRKLAEEYCNKSWSSFCLFFFTMVQDNDC